jgi:hypothetical protein
VREGGIIKSYKYTMRRIPAEQNQLLVLSRKLKKIQYGFKQDFLLQWLAVRELRLLHHVPGTREMCGNRQSK